MCDLLNLRNTWICKCECATMQAHRARWALLAQWIKIKESKTHKHNKTNNFNKETNDFNKLNRVKKPKLQKHQNYQDFQTKLPILKPVVKYDNVNNKMIVEYVKINQDNNSNSNSNPNSNSNSDFDSNSNSNSNSCDKNITQSNEQKISLNNLHSDIKLFELRDML